MEFEDYWNLDNILASEQKVKVNLTEGIEEYGHLGEESKDNLEEGDKLEMPLWLAKLLYSADKLDIATPKFFGKSFRDTLIADPTIINLQDKSTYFYEVSLFLSEVLGEEQINNIIPVIHKTFVERYTMISDYAEGKSVSQNMSSFTRKLWNVEAYLFTVNKERIKETVNFKQQHSIDTNYGTEDNSMKKGGKRVRTK